MFRNKGLRASRYLGLKQYELTDHLGNVNVSVLDKLSGTGDGNPGEYAYLSANISSFTDYYPFGMPMPERNGSIEKYRFGYGNHEKLNEVSGIGNTIDMGDRWLDTRLGRTPKTDAKAYKYPSISPYSYAANNPIYLIDPDGREIFVYHNGKAYQYKPGIKPVPGSPEVLFKVHEAATYAMQTKTGARVWNTVGNSDKVVNIYFKDATLTDRNTNQFNPFNISGRTESDKKLGDLNWDYNSRVIVTGGWNNIEGRGIQSGYISPSTVLTHELGHAYLMIKALGKGLNSKEWSEYKSNTNEYLGYDEQYDTKDERINVETIERPYINEINAIEGENGSYQRPRYNHEGDIEYDNNDADVNKNPSKSEQQKQFNSSY